MLELAQNQAYVGRQQHDIPTNEHNSAKQWNSPYSRQEAVSIPQLGGETPDDHDDEHTTTSTGVA
jgi:hypothetical protein